MVAMSFDVFSSRRLVSIWNHFVPSLAVVCVLLGVGCGSSTEGPAETAGGVDAAKKELQKGMEEGSGSFDHQSYDQLLSQHVNQAEGTVDYGSLKQNQKALEQYLGRIADAELETLPRDEQLALLINAYNAYTLKLILENYPDIESIKDLSNPWSTERYEVGGHTLSLDQIEHELIRPVYKDPRIHFAVNCAAVDCPYLASFAYTGAELDDQLDSRTDAILTNEQFVSVEENTLRYPKVMKWYRSDFVSGSFQGSASNIAQYIKPHSRKSIRAFIETNGGDPPVEPMSYDWSLNDAE
jgi:hypothetical protein